MATLIEIHDYEVSNKSADQIPEKVEKIVKCFNPNCITNKEDIPTRFDALFDENKLIKLACNYCEKTTSKENIVFL